MVKSEPKYKLKLFIVGKVKYRKTGASVEFFRLDKKKKISIGIYSFDTCNSIEESQLKIYEEIKVLWVAELPFTVKFSEDKKTVEAFIIIWNKTC